MGPAGLDRAFETLGKITDSKVADGCDAHDKPPVLCRNG